MKKLLLVEDDQYLREAMSQFFKTNGFQVTEAVNGKIARDIFSIDDFDLVISDIQMPFLDGIELLKWIKSRRPTVPVILITGFTNLCDSSQAQAMGAAAFLTKPFKNAELLEVVKKTLGPSPEAKPAVENINLDFCKVSIEEFVSRSKIEFDVYVRLSAEKYVKIGMAGSEIPTERIRSYQEKGVQFLHIRKEDFAKLVSFNLEISKCLIKNDAISQLKKINFMKYTGEVILEKAFVEGVDRDSFDDASDMLVNTVNVLTDGDETFALLDMLNTHSDWVYAHSVAVSMFAIMIARKLKHTSSQIFFKLGMAGLFHEIGYKEIPREIIDKQRPLLTQSERALIESHVTRSRDILSLIKGVPNDVLEIIYQHHEDVMGQGYPSRTKKERIHPLAKIFQTADVFADVAIKNKHSSGMSGLQGVTYVENFYGDRLDPASLRALRGIFDRRVGI